MDSEACFIRSFLKSVVALEKRYEYSKKFANS
jgi:hypothetical protein